MPDAILTQAEADVLLATQKEAEPGNRPLFPNLFILHIFSEQRPHASLPGMSQVLSVNT